MIPNKLIQIAVVMAVLAAATGQLPKLIQQVRVAQYQLLKDSQASKWGRPLLLPVKTSNSSVGSVTYKNEKERQLHRQ